MRVLEGTLLVLGFVFHIQILFLVALRIFQHKQTNYFVTTIKKIQHQGVWKWTNIELDFWGVYISSKLKYNSSMCSPCSTPIFYNRLGVFHPHWNLLSPLFLTIKLFTADKVMKSHNILIGRKIIQKMSNLQNKEFLNI